MAELLAKYQGDKSPALIVLIGQEAGLPIFLWKTPYAAILR